MFFFVILKKIIVTIKRLADKNWITGRIFIFGSGWDSLSPAELVSLAQKFIMEKL